MKVTGFSIECKKIEIEEERYRRAKRDNRLDHELDVYLSDMDGYTVVVEENGTVVNPYGGTADLLKMVAPLLDLIPVREIKDYVIHRERAEAEAE